MDEQLTITSVERAARGDRAAQASLLRELQDPWFRMCLSLLRGDAERARDATQETALRFLKLLPTFRGESHIRTWSMGIAINVVRELRRRESRAMSEQDDVSLAATPAVTESPALVAGRAEEQAMIRSMIDDLPERQREAVVLRFFEDYSIEQTADAMNCAAGTVKATIHHALRALREKLKSRQLT